MTVTKRDKTVPAPMFTEIAAADRGTVTIGMQS